MYDIYGFVRGPLVWVAFAIFIIGLLFQARRFYDCTRESSLPSPPASVLGDIKSSGNLRLLDISTSIFGVHPLLTIMTTAFHACVIILPIFLLAHNILLSESFGISLFTFPEFVADMLTWFVLLGGLFFFMRRIFVYRVRVITTAYDYLILLIVIAPFLTGYAATRQWFDYETVLILHIVAGELMLVAIPFTKLKHGLLFFLYRYLMHYEHTLGRGARVWSYNQVK
ncbi:MAG: hypothetical protein JXO50_09985 [Deltaproteobacteria bacterium]|nr:hypothetical protein [Candidatus Anaeroferrophillus wilburensis]